MSWRRADHLRRLEGTFDVAIIGGGVVGAGVALDAAARGMSVVLLEGDDYAAGTSMRSTKLLHGGVRYLPQFRFGQIRDSLREQAVLERIAPHLYHPLDFVLPIFRNRTFADMPRWMAHRWLAGPALRIGLRLYSWLGRGRAAPRHADADEARRLLPNLDHAGLLGAMVYRDAQTDDARLVLALIRTAVERGSVAVNHVWVDRVAATVAGYELHATDRLTDSPLVIQAQTVVAATGAFAPPAPANTDPVPLRHSRGTHLIVPADELGITDKAVVLPETEDGRVIFVIPWHGTAIVGTTDVPAPGDDLHPAPPPDEVDYLRRHVKDYFGIEPTVITAWSGLRSLVADHGSTARASREALVRQLRPGYVQVAGGKLTGYRHIAADVTDLVGEHLGVTRPSPTADLTLSGAQSGSVVSTRLLDRYGAHAAAIADLAASEPALAAELGDGTTLAEVRYAATHECAATIADVALRRTRVSWLTADHGRAAAEPIAAVLGAELGWDDDRRAEELHRFAAVLEAEGL